MLLTYLEFPESITPPRDAGSDSKSRNEDPGFLEQLLSGRFPTRTLISSGIKGQNQDTEEDIDKFIDETMREENERR